MRLYGEKGYAGRAKEKCNSYYLVRKVDDWSIKLNKRLIVIGIYVMKHVRQMFS